VELRILGPVELMSDRRSLNIGGPRQRTVLAMLALNVKRVVPVDRLIDAVWDDSPPRTARSQVQICVSALRKLFSEAGREQAIIVRSPGYLLDLETDELDSERFGGLVQAAKQQAADGRAADAVATLHQAIAMWRGCALAGVPSDLVQRSATMLEQQRIAALEERIRLDLALARHEEVIGELRALCEEYPLHEQLHSYLMVALYRSGRQADALEVARRTRNTLLEEIGIEPGSELQSLELAILNQDASLELPASAKPAPWSAAHAVPAEPSETPQPSAPAPAPAAGQTGMPRQLPASIADFTGRDEQLDQIKRLLQDGGNPYAMRIVAISGMGGVGKSSLAIRAAHELADEFPDGHLYADLRTGGEDTAATVLARFLRALKVSSTAVPDELAERAETYRSQIAGKRILIVLDDVVSEEQVLPLLPGSPSCAVLATSRAKLGGLPSVSWVDVTVFDMDSSIELLAQIIGSDRVTAEPQATAELVDLCGGLPLALRIVGARLAARPHWQIDHLVRRLTDKARRLDELAHRGLGLRSTIDLAYAALSKKSKRLFHLFALLEGGDAPGWTAAALLDTDLLDAEDVLEDLVDAQMIESVRYADGERPRYRFHDLIRVYAFERLVQTESEAERRAALGRVLGAWLSLADEAHRRQYGGDFTVLHGTAPRWRRLSADTEIGSDPVRWWETERRALTTAVRQAAESGLDELCWDLALTLVSMFETLGYLDDWRDTAHLGLDAAARAGNRRGQAAMLYSAGSLGIVQYRLDTAEGNLLKALSIFEADGDRHGHALVLRNMAYIDSLHGRFAEMMEKYARSLDLLREVGDRVGEAHVLRAMARFRIDEGDTEEARALLDAALSCCQEVGSSRVEAQILHRYAQLHMSAGETELASGMLQRVLVIVRDTGDRTGEAHALYGLGVVHLQEGRLDDAATALRQALDLSRLVSERLVEGDALRALGEVSIAEADPATALTHLDGALPIFTELRSSLRQAKTLMLLSGLRAAADPERAGRELETAIALVAELDSKEAANLRTRLESARSALASEPAMSGSATA
jgi:DNA-binding SARP family transcriptional activator